MKYKMELTFGRYWRKFRQVVLGPIDAETKLGEPSTEPIGCTKSRADEVETEPEGTLADYDPSKLCSRRDFVTEIGVRPEELFPQLIEEHGGTLPQKEFTEFTNLSNSTISRLLQEMEDDGRIVRVQVGRENMVCLPEHAPSDGLPPTDRAESPPRI
ncbi:hypothetical protein HUG10_01685 [Halorarum halophilum]|uniref:DUF7343 domain-containing protein n=1 Tax=Halorarum halophilum TaxID=2743090 RepID=A0A7D5GVR0_9EURY|nr:hypothetical protein [Halobaculum halophilum]QLG26329.1 hypothetical protein HUG10_01685 [Halobaculum halophilum]